MTGVPPQIKAIDEELAASSDEYREHLAQRVRLLSAKLSAFDSLLRERNRIAAERDRIVDLIALYGEAEHVNGPQHEERFRSLDVSSVMPGEFSNASEWPVWKACAEILRREHREMFTGELVTRLMAGRRELSDKNPSSQVNASMSAVDGVFYKKLHNGKARWGLVEWKKDKGPTSDLTV